MKSLKGFFKPKNPTKYKGDPTNIIFRSGLELKVMLWLDNNKHVLYWNSEEIVVPYRCKTDNRIHRYFPDFVVQMKTPDQKITTYMIEVKPFSQTLPPKKGEKKHKKTFLNEVMTYTKNYSKWESAKEFCADKGWVFKIITEKDINGPAT